MFLPFYKFSSFSDLYVSADDNESEVETSFCWNCLRPGIDFTYILREVFTHADHESITIQLSRQYLFTLFGSENVKVARRTLMGLISPTFYKQLLPLQISKAQKADDLTVFFALLWSASVKAARKMLVKSTSSASSSDAR